MEIFDFFKKVDINQGIKEYKSVAGGILLDVRTWEEYLEGHIPESKNVPLQSIHQVENVVENKEIPLFVYCHAGIRSYHATELLKQMGYTKVTDIGGIDGYEGTLEVKN